MNKRKQKPTIYFKDLFCISHSILNIYQTFKWRIKKTEIDRIHYLESERDSIERYFFSAKRRFNRDISIPNQQTNVALT